jgi:endoglucanase
LKARSLVGLALACCSPALGPPSPLAEPPKTPPAAVTVPKTEATSGSQNGPAAPAMPGKNVPAIKVNTVGYPPAWRKIAVFNVEPRRAVVKDEQGNVAHEISAASVSKRGVDPASGDPVWQVDLSALERPGRYTVESEGAKSDPFTIGADVYRRALTLAQKHYYFQRCRTKLEAPSAAYEGDVYTRASACHTHDDVGWDFETYPEKKRKWRLEGGWHDAGNFEMYVPSTAPTAHALLMAFEDHPELFSDGDLGIPESKNKIPDLLDEVAWGLRWVLSMQDASGAFRAREAVYDWSENGPADRERKARWVSGVGTASTAKATAVLARAARVYRKHDTVLARRAEIAARAGWAFLEKHPERILLDNKGSPQSAWDDTSDFKETGARFVAAAETWKSFRIASALASAEMLMGDPETEPERFIAGAWPNLSRWALMLLSFDEKTKPAVRDDAKKRLLVAAESLRSGIEQTDGYRCASKPADYYWGHNSNLLEKAHVLAFARRLDPSRTWLVEAARDQWHWILGRNPNGYSMVTRVGKGPDRMYHVEWGKSERPPPGYLVGGPNSANMAFLAPNAPAKALLWDNPKPLRTGLAPHSLWHFEQSDLWDAGFVKEGSWEKGWWSVTEPDIYYNANFVLVAAEMQGL